MIDVNTGRFVGSRSKKSGGRLEDTITKNNLEAVKEVVRQLRLRDIGGIIVIDFIDMANPKNRAAVEEALRTELERDRTKTYVVEISPLGLVEMTRQNVTDGPREMMTRSARPATATESSSPSSLPRSTIERKLALARHAGLACEGVQGRARTRRSRRCSSVRRHAPARARGASRSGGSSSSARRRPPRPLPRARAGHGREVAPEAAGRRRGRRSTSSSARSACYDPQAGAGKVDGVEIVVAEAQRSSSARRCTSGSPPSWRASPTAS